MPACWQRVRRWRPAGRRSSPSMASTPTSGASRSCRRTGSSTRSTRDLRSRSAPRSARLLVGGVRELCTRLLRGLRGGHHAARRQPAGADAPRRRAGAHEDHSQRRRLSGAEPPAAGKLGRSPDRRFGRPRRPDQGHQDLSASDRAAARRVPRPARPGHGADRRAAGLLPGVQGAGGGTGLVRRRAFHRPGRCRALFSATSTSTS